MKINDLYELMALNKALVFLRFQCQDYEAQHISGSPLIKNIHLEVMKSLKEMYKKENVFIPDDLGYIEDYNEYLLTIINTIRNINGWYKLEESIKRTQIEILISPYKIKENTLKFLINYEK